MTMQQIKEELLLKNSELECTCSTEENEDDSTCEKCQQLEWINSLCTCGKCKQCMQMLIDKLSQEACTCIYKDVVEELPNEEGVLQSTKNQVLDIECERCKQIGALQIKLEWYDMFEKAYIPQDLWDKCYVVDGVIMQHSEEQVEKSEIELLRERLEIAENALLDMMLQTTKL